MDAGFIADRMLGRLAVWMRLIGLDTIYFNSPDEEKLIETVLETGRILVTRDRLLSIRKKIRARTILLRGNDFREQLKELIRHIGVDPTKNFYTRCLRCNTLIEEITRAEVAGKVPPYVFQTQRHFSRCPSCKRIYWSATHREHTVRELNKIVESLDLGQNIVK